MNRYCLVVPVYNHEARLHDLMAALAPHELQCYLVDDGSDAAAKRVIAAIANEHPFIRLITLDENRGKGVAVTAGLRAAFDDSFTHAIQMDSDGQHTPDHIPSFIDAADRHPRDVISGFRSYESMPRGRSRGRKLTDFWVRINTLSKAIGDSMCGYRVYPLEETMNLLDAQPVGRRMDFDTDIIVRLYWMGLDVTHVEVDVSYDPGVASHFRMFADNVRISIMHTRHFFGMLMRLPRLLTR